MLSMRCPLRHMRLGAGRKRCPSHGSRNGHTGASTCAPQAPAQLLLSPDLRSSPSRPPLHATGSGASPARSAELALLMSKSGAEGTLWLVFHSYLSEKGRPVDGSAQLGAEDLHCVLQVREATPPGPLNTHTAVQEMGTQLQRQCKV